MINEYIRRAEALEITTRTCGDYAAAFAEIRKIPAADVAEVVRCKDCKYSTLPSELTQRYGKAGTLTCHNKYSPCNRRNVSENDFCSYGEWREE